MIFLYDLFFIFFALVFFPYTVMKGKWHDRFPERFGRFSEDIRTSMRRRPNIWFHAVSVGEVQASLRIINRIKEAYPSHQIVLSMVTSSGFQLARAKFDKEIILIFAPLDFSVIVRRYIRAIQPVLYIAAETEIWPNLFSHLKLNAVPIVQINGRLSQQSFSRYRRLGFLVKNVLNCVNHFCMRSEEDARGIRALGVASQKITLAGNLKYDDHPEADDPSTDAILKRKDQVFWVAGSTHPGEEIIVTQIYRSLISEFPGLRLILAPRHIERTSEIKKQLEDSGFVPVLYSNLTDQKEIELNHEDVLLIDTIGHLRSLYKLADIVFMGKSLTASGGQNIIEPAFFSKAIMTGPSMQNFADIMATFLRADAMICVNNKDDLRESMLLLLRDPQRRGQLGTNAAKVVRQMQGATEKTFNILTTFLPTR